MLPRKKGQNLIPRSFLTGVWACDRLHAGWDYPRALCPSEQCGVRWRERERERQWHGTRDKHCVGTKECCKVRRHMLLSTFPGKKKTKNCQKTKRVMPKYIFSLTDRQGSSLPPTWTTWRFCGDAQPARETIHQDKINFCKLKLPRCQEGFLILSFIPSVGLKLPLIWVFWVHRPWTVHLVDWMDCFTIWLNNFCFAESFSKKLLGIRKKR